MEVNKEQAEKCRDLGATALRTGDYEKAVRMLEKSLKLYALPGVEALLSHAQSKLNSGKGDTNGSSSPSSSSNRRSTSNGYSSTTTDDDDDERTSTQNQRRRQQSTASTASSSSSIPSSSPPQRQQSTTGADGRAYTDEQVQIIQKILRARATGRGAHYRVLGLEMGERATENDIKKAYRKISLKVHPDKNSAPGADEAFKAVGLAYATLSDNQKRTIYDRYGDEDPDSNQGMRAANPFGRRAAGGAQEVSPEDIFNAFFGGAGMGGPGFHVYSSGFGPGMHFAGGGNRWQQQNNQQQRRRNQNQQQQQQPQNEATANIGMLLQFLPILIILLTSFFRGGSDESNYVYSTTTVSPGENKYFSLTNKAPFTNRLNTKLTPVKDIPYYVSDKFLRTYYRDRYQLSQVERMVESAYELYLYNECQTQSKYRQSLHRKSATANKNPSTTPEERTRLYSIANEFKLTRCEEYNDLFPNSRRKNTGRQQQQQQRQQQQQQQQQAAAS